MFECKGVGHMSQIPTHFGDSESDPYEMWVDSSVQWAVGSVLEDRAHTCKIEKHLLSSARLFVPPLLIDKSLASDSQLLRSFFRESGLTLTCARERHS